MKPQPGAGALGRRRVWLGQSPRRFHSAPSLPDGPHLGPPMTPYPGVVPVAEAWAQRVLLDFQKPDKLFCTLGKFSSS